MKIVVGSWFRLPRLGTEVFSRLMRCGMAYDKEMGFLLGSHADIEAAVGLLRNALGEEVELSLRCMICFEEACRSCSYLPVCDRRRVSTMCLCAEHAAEEDVYERYGAAFLSRLAE